MSEETSTHSAIAFKKQPITMDYRNKVILAPMVRVGLLPFRRLALDYGADIVYTEEIVDRKLIKSREVYHPDTGITELIRSDPGASGNEGNFIFSTDSADTPCVLQLGTADPELAVEAARKVEHLVDAIDVNMGCPKGFSLQGSMGAALLSQKERASAILKALVANIKKPITCKVRLLDTVEKSIDFVKAMEETGIAAIAIHARHIPQRPREPAHWDLLAQVVPHLKIPVIANGDMFTWQEIEHVVHRTGCASVMLARGPLQNFSMFKPNLYRRQVGGSLSCLDWMEHEEYRLSPSYHVEPPLPVLEHALRLGHDGNVPTAVLKYIAMKALDGQPKHLWHAEQIARTRTNDDLLKVFDVSNRNRWTGVDVIPSPAGKALGINTVNFSPATNNKKHERNDCPTLPAEADIEREPKRPRMEDAQLA
jgi:tRNA-dihydrouridine synthase 2